MVGAQLGFDELGFDLGAPRLVRVTPARLGTWRQCRRRYRLGYLDRAPRGAGRAPSTLGAVVHLALRAFFDLPPARRTPDAAAALVDRNWSGEGFRDADQQREYRERARGWVSAYAAEHGAVQPLAQERWVSAPVGGIVAEGRADRIDGRDGAAVVVDYKTGRWVPTDADAAESEALALYAVATERTLRRPCTRVELHHLPTGTVAAHDHDAASLRAHVERAGAAAAELARATAALEDGGDPEALFPPAPQAACGSCDVRRHCPEGRAAAPEAAPWAHLVP